MDIGQLAGGQIDRVFELVSTVLAGPHVSNAMIRQTLGPVWCNNSSTTLRTLDDWPVIHGNPPMFPRHHTKIYLNALKKPSTNNRQAAELLRNALCVLACDRGHTVFVTWCPILGMLRPGWVTNPTPRHPWSLGPLDT
jgi:hypothetical protein